MSKDSIVLLGTLLLSLLSLILFYRKLLKERENFKQWIKSGQHNEFTGLLPYIIIPLSLIATDHPYLQEIFKSISTNTAAILIMETLLTSILAIGPFLLVFFISRKRYPKS